MFITTFFIFGLIIGSFLNVVILRLYREESITGRSRCPNCKKAIYWYDNIPIVSYLILRGKCRNCGKPISIQYPLVELATGILFVVGYFFTLQGHLSQVTPAHLFYFALSRQFIFISLLIVIFVYDLRFYLIADIITIPGIIIALALNILLGISWSNLILAGIIGGGFFLLQYVISKGRWIGGGDIRLGILMGAMLGFPHILVALMLSYVFGGGLALPLLIFGKKHFGDKLPFGTFLTLGTLITIFWGESIIKWYVNFL